MPVSQLGQDSRPHLGFAGARLDRGKAGLGIGEDQASWAVDGTRQKLFHGEFGVGDRVRGLYKNGKWYLASVEAYNPDDGTYLLKWDDGDSQDRVKTPEQLQAADGDEATGMHPIMPCIGSRPNESELVVDEADRGNFGMDASGGQ